MTFGWVEALPELLEDSKVNDGSSWELGPKLG